MKKRKRKYEWVACGHRHRITRLALGITEAEAAEAVGVAVSTWKRWEAGGVQKGGAFMNFADAYDVCVNWLCIGDASGLKPKFRAGKVPILPAINSYVREERYRRALLHYVNQPPPQRPRPAA